MLEIRPNCEFCDKDLPPASTEARICSYECTFCSDCVENLIQNACPNCGGGFVSRPIRPSTERRAGTGLAHQPASTNRVHSSYSREEISQFVSTVRDISPELR
jgi:hypothetical protein